MRPIFSLCLAVAAAGCAQPPASSPMPALPQLPSAAQPLAGSGYKVIYSFQRARYGKSPNGLVALKGALYGTTFFGGANGDKGEVFRITPAGQAHIVHSFSGYPSDGESPVDAPLAVKDVLYGTTYSGGSVLCYGSSGYSGCGAVFKVTPSGAEKILHSFSDKSNDGINPVGGLTAMNGALYGVTDYGGGNACSQISESHYGCGIVFTLSTSGAERMLHAFRGAPYDGAFAIAGLTALNGKLYGTTIGGGIMNCYLGCGVVFEVSTSGKERVLYSFYNGADGGAPEGNLVALNGRLYGTTASGGLSGNGTVFEIGTSGKERVLYSFRGGTDGAMPAAGLIALNSTLYGTTPFGGSRGCGSNNGCGTIFNVTTSGIEHVLYRFKGGIDGANPYTGLTALNGILYGTTRVGGSANLGTVYRISP